MTCYSEYFEWYRSGRLLHQLTIFNPTESRNFQKNKNNIWLPWTSALIQQLCILWRRRGAWWMPEKKHTIHELQQKSWKKNYIFHELELQCLRSKLSPTNSADVTTVHNLFTVEQGWFQMDWFAPANPEWAWTEDCLVSLPSSFFLCFSFFVSLHWGVKEESLKRRCSPDSYRKTFLLLNKCHVKYC